MFHGFVLECAVCTHMLKYACNRYVGMNVKAEVSVGCLPQLLSTVLLEMVCQGPGLTAGYASPQVLGES